VENRTATRDSRSSSRSRASLEETRRRDTALVIAAELSAPAVAVEVEVELVAPPPVLMRAVMVRVQVRYLEGASTKAPETATEAGEEGRKVMRYGEEEDADAGHGVSARLYGCRFLVACMLSLSDLWSAASAAGGGEVREAKSGMAGRRPAKQPGRSEARAHASVRASTWQLADRSMRTASGSC
jgi:hypothetical protein